MWQWHCACKPLTRLYSNVLCWCHPVANITRSVLWHCSALEWCLSLHIDSQTAHSFTILLCSSLSRWKIWSAEGHWATHGYRPRRSADTQLPTHSRTIWKVEQRGIHTLCDSWWSPRTFVMNANPYRVNSSTLFLMTVKLCQQWVLWYQCCVWPSKLYFELICMKVERYETMAGQQFPVSGGQAKVSPHHNDHTYACALNMHVRLQCVYCPAL